MLTYADYHQWLFPGDFDPLIGNPIGPDATVREILEEVSCRSGISVDWLARSTREVLEGLAGLQCLWFLHGAQGRVHMEPAKTTNLGVPVDMGDPSRELTALAKKYRDEQNIKLHRRNRPVILEHVIKVNWDDGVLYERTVYDGPDAGKAPKETARRLGRWLQKRGASAGLMRAFETREEKKKNETWDFVVSADPIDILTMSHGRSWPSCMRPGEMFPYGPLTDMAAGSAIIWFYRPGGDAPVGRVILRPYLTVKNEPGIATGGRLYGPGPDTSLDALNKMLEPWLAGVEIERVNICPMGRAGRALTRAIYSDTDRQAGGCKQSVEEYEDAYENLRDAPWPSASFESKIPVEAARRHVEEYGWRGKNDESEDEYAYENVYNEMEHFSSSGHKWITDWYLNSSPEYLEIYKTITSPDTMDEWVDEYVENELNYSNEYPILSARGVDAFPESIKDDLKHVLLSELARNLYKDMDFLFAATVTEDQHDDFLESIRGVRASDTVYAVTPQEIARAKYKVVGGLVWDEEALNDEFDIVVDDDGRYLDEDSGKEIFSVFLMPVWFYEESLGGKEYPDILDEGVLYYTDAIDVEDALQLKPSPLKWLDDLL